MPLNPKGRITLLLAIGTHLRKQHNMQGQRSVLVVMPTISEADAVTTTRLKALWLIKLWTQDVKHRVET